MQVIHIQQASQLSLYPSCVAIGFFDGLHLGHMELIHEVEKISDTTGLKKAFMTFDQHPKAVYLNQDIQYLMSLQQKIDFIEARGFDYFFIIDFDKRVASLSSKSFVEHYFKKQNIKHIVCGFDFTFGAKGAGKAKDLLAYQQYFDVTIVDKYMIDGHKVSSSLMKSYLHQGDLEKVNKMLGRYFQVQGEVIYGRQNGRKIGFPTANVEASQYVLLKKGVYGVYCYKDGQRYRGMANIGHNPTFGALEHLSLEVNLFDYEGDLYGQILTVDFVFRVRDEKKFESIDLLVQQLHSDQEFIQSRLV